jgi:putative glutamine amidotransferase
MPKPLIGITTYRQTHEQGFPLFSLAEAYVQAVSQAGGVPVSIPLGLPDDQLQTLIPRLDGVLFSGGGDIAPERYGADDHPEVDFVDVDRDRVEYQLVKDVIQAGKPFLGICRGIQVIIAAMGGMLYTHIPDQLPDSIHHPYIEGKPRGYLAHEVLVEDGTRLHAILGRTSLMVNSMHHQGISRLAPGFTSTVHAPDGLIEGVELSDYRFGFAVQWHPEWLTDHAPHRALFKAFVEAAAQ